MAGRVAAIGRMGLSNPASETPFRNGHAYSAAEGVFRLRRGMNHSDSWIRLALHPRAPEEGYTNRQQTLARKFPHLFFNQTASKYQKYIQNDAEAIKYNLCIGTNWVRSLQKA